VNSVEMRHDDVDCFLRWLYRDSSPSPVNDLLDKANALRLKPALNYDAARELCRQALQLTEPGSLTSVSRSSTGLAHMYLGLVYYAGGDLDEAIERLGQASEEFRLHGRNQAVAEFAVGAAYSWRRERSQVYGHIKLDVLSTLRYGMESSQIEQVNKKWEEIQSRLNDSPPREPEPPEPFPGEERGGKTRRKYPDLELPNLPQQRPPLTERIVIPAAIGLTIVVGAILAFALSKYNPMALLAYGLAVSVAIYVIVKRLQCKAPRDCALVIETGGGSKVRWGPTTYYRWPSQERLRALVPLYPLQYTTPEKSFQLGMDGKMDFRLMVYYRVNAWNRVTIASEDSTTRNDSKETHAISMQSGQAKDPLAAAKKDEENVLNAVYRVQLENTGTGDRTGMTLDDKSFSADDLRRIWEKRLLKDIIATMIEVLPGRTKAGLTGQDVKARDDLIDDVWKRLAVRVHQWGMEIGDMGILDATAKQA
jgi:hypothetical protein